MILTGWFDRRAGSERVAPHGRGRTL